MSRHPPTSATPLRVAIDAHMVGEQETGNETYVVNLIRGLAAIDAETSYFLYSSHPASLDLCGPLPPNFARRRVSPRTSMIRIPVGMPLRTLADRVDVLHVTYVAPPVISGRLVVTVHDITFALFPEMFPLRERLILGTLVPRSLRRAQAIITISENSRADISRRYGIPKDRITVVYLPISPAFRRLREETIAATQARYGIRTPYLVAVGNLQPRKNLPRLIRAFARLRADGAYTGRLVLVGKGMGQQASIFQEMRAQGLEREIVLTGYVPEEDVVALLNGADAFVYPSIYEGFGLPPLEAMASGCPVVTANTSSLPEVVGDAGLMVDPLSEAALAAAIARITQDDELRRMLVGRGLERVQRFSAEAAARTTLGVYQRVARSGGRGPAGDDRPAGASPTSSGSAARTGTDEAPPASGEAREERHGRASTSYPSWHQTRCAFQP